ncbi:DUF2927 domain-containing protein [Mariniflexile sp. AS56]|uniref:DUF2927 domain-containing protein n=1 Tax=Mariniflexile sp. AS56 TaxID=3063957 RepID=UPI0026EB3652|nr:DUF2927 domain-containing protein [Mariniflexile sp. AS56]MDO7171220.1 DUF2927 domain-containing protein [Mariniflexile sp. AS56]
MKILRTIYFIVSLLLLAFFGNHYYKYQFDKKIIYADKSKEELISFFNEISLGFEYGNSKKVTRKWNEPLKLFIIKDSIYKEQTLYIKKTIEKINKLVGNNFSISITSDSINANGHLFLCSHDKIKMFSKPYNEIFKNVNENFFGYFSLKTNKDYNIFKTSIFINTTKPLEFQKSAIIEEITQSLGFGNDTEIYYDSMFNQNKYIQTSATLKYSEFDKKIIELLYNEKMKTGLNRFETEPILRNIID